MAVTNLRRALTIGCMLALLCATSTARPLLAEETGSAAPVQETAGQQPEAVSGSEGIASYYARRYQGRRTNSGTRYDPKKLTAAHPSLPHGTRVKVINLANDREVIVTINDRCRSRKQPFIDLSRAAAQRLGFLGKGTARVRIIPLDDNAS